MTRGPFVALGGGLMLAPILRLRLAGVTAALAVTGWSGLVATTADSGHCIGRTC